MSNVSQPAQPGSAQKPERESAADLRHRAELNSLVTRVSIDFVHVAPGELDEVITRALAALGKFLRMQRAFVLRISPPESNNFSPRFEWRSKSPSPANDLPAGTMPWLRELLQGGDAVCFKRIDELPDEAQAEREWFTAFGVQDTVLVPIVSRGQVVGALGASRPPTDEPLPRDAVALMRMIGDVIESGLERSESDQALRERIEAEELIRAISTMFISLSAEEFQAGFDKALESLGRFLDIDRCYIGLFDSEHMEKPKAYLWYDPEVRAPDPTVVNLRMLEKLNWGVGKLFRRESVALSSPSDLPPEAAAERALMEARGIKSVVIVPIHAKSQPVGFLGADCVRRERVWTDLDVTLLTIIAHILGTACVRQASEEEHDRLEAHVQHTQKLESMSVLAGGIAHDFNNLLVGIMGNAELMMMDMADDDPRRKNVEQIESASRRAADLVNQLLTYTGKGLFRVEPIDLSTVINEVSTLVSTVVPKKIQFEKTLTPDLPLVAGDPAQIKQIIMNLVTNASDAIGDQAGKVLVFTGSGVFDRDYLQGAVGGPECEEGQYVFIEVTDNGAGMDSGTIARIFDPFFTTKFAGRGLGLAATLGIVRAHRGAIKVLSWPQKGTTMQVLLPATTFGSKKAEARPAGADDRAAGGATILVVDDEISVRRVTQAVLEHFGYAVMVAENGLRALRMFEQNPQSIDLILLDMTMPKMDGEETLRRLREISDSVPVVLTSGYTEVEVTTKVQGLSIAGFIAKPFSPKDLLAEIQRLI